MRVALLALVLLVVAGASAQTTTVTDPAGDQRWSGKVGGLLGARLPACQDPSTDVVLAEATLSEGVLRERIVFAGEATLACQVPGLAPNSVTRAFHLYAGATTYPGFDYLVMWARLDAAGVGLETVVVYEYATGRIGHVRDASFATDGAEVRMSIPSEGTAWTDDGSFTYALRAPFVYYGLVETDYALTPRLGLDDGVIGLDDRFCGPGAEDLCW